MTLASIEPTTVRRRVITSDETVYRWHNDDKDVMLLGRFKKIFEV